MCVAKVTHAAAPSHCGTPRRQDTCEELAETGAAHLVGLWESTYQLLPAAPLLVSMLQSVAGGRRMRAHFGATHTPRDQHTGQMLSRTLGIDPAQYRASIQLFGI